MAKLAPVVNDRVLGLAYAKLYIQEKAKNPTLTPESFNNNLLNSTKSDAAAAKPNAKKGKK